jgi:triosephosphate isomerase
VNPFRRPLIAGNWKMNAGGREACALAAMVADRTRGADRVDVVVAPPFTAVAAVAHEIEEIRGSIDVSEGFGVGVAGQNMHAKASGAFTGEIGPAMLRDAGAMWVILGHSERRQLFGETDEGVGEKVRAAFESDLRPIACVGETLAEREAGETLAIVERQLRAFMQHFAGSPGVGVVAYEPVWAIGTGRVAKPEDAQEVHAKIRELLAEVSEEVAEATRILYGGSVKGDNAAGLLDQADIDGALVGGASLESEGFGKIVDAAQAVAVRLAAEAGEATDSADAMPTGEGSDAADDEAEDADDDAAEDLSKAHAPGPGGREPGGDPAKAPASEMADPDADADDDAASEDDDEDSDEDDDEDGDDEEEEDEPAV